MRTSALDASISRTVTRSAGSAGSANADGETLPRDPAAGPGSANAGAATTIPSNAPPARARRRDTSGFMVVVPPHPTTPEQLRGFQRDGAALMRGPVEGSMVQRDRLSGEDHRE